MENNKKEMIVKYTDETMKSICNIDIKIVKCICPSCNNDKLKTISTKCNSCGQLLMFPD